LAEKQQIRAIKGVRDILPPASAAWDRAEGTAREVFATYGFGEIRPPIFEQTELFARSVGAESDIVHKEMYTLRDRPDWLELPHTIGDFGRFIQTVREAMAKGQVPNDPVNMLALQDLELQWKGLESLTRPTGEPIDPNFNIARLVALPDAIRLGEDISLRPEATASVCRAYIEHGMHTLPGNVKLYYMGPMFRRERPQKGRYRQFYQIGAEVLGQSDAPGIDAELIEMLVTYFNRCGLTGTTLYLNSIGDRNCRPQYVELLRAELRKVHDKLGADSQRRIETNPLRVLDSKTPDEQPIIENLPRIADHLCDACREHFAEVQRQLAMRGVAYELNWRLVRGLDYYMRTTFEIVAPGLGSQNAVCGGGRYDGLVELLGGPPTKGIGFAIGTDRLMLSLEAAGKTPVIAAVDLFVVWLGAAAQEHSIKLVQRLRAAGIKVELPATEMKPGKGLQLGDKLGARYGLIVGENEIAAGRYTLKRLSDARQTSVTEAELLEEFRATE
jgi:histidyl-tRNA synthetase